MSGAISASATGHRLRATGAMLPRIHLGTTPYPRPRQPWQVEIPSSGAIDLLRGRHAVWPLRDQRGRNTCVAAALTAALELRRAGPRSAPQLLSMEFVYDMVRARFGPRDASEQAAWDLGAIHTRDAIAVLSENGVVSEHDYPYLAASQVPALPSSPVVPADLMSRAALNRAPVWDVWDYEAPQRNKIGAGATLLSWLRQGRPAAVSLPEFSKDGILNLNNEQARDSGIIPAPSRDWDISAFYGHSVCVVGYQPDRAGGWFIFRNSWGMNFGRARATLGTPVVPAIGYGAISAAYIDEHAYYMGCPG